MGAGFEHHTLPAASVITGLKHTKIPNALGQKHTHKKIIIKTTTTTTLLLKRAIRNWRGGKIVAV